jgi:hypothetical protein
MLLVNYNITGYLIYLAVTSYITLYVGRLFYSNGEAYLRNIFHDEPDYIRPINRILLIGYYLVNLGYATTTLSTWGQISSLTGLLNILGTRLGFILVFLGVTHYFNMLIVNIIHSIIHNRHVKLKN